MMSKGDSVAYEYFAFLVLCSVSASFDYKDFSA